MALMKRPLSASRRPLERGGFSWVTVLMVTGLAGAFYLGWVWVPVYVVHYEVKQVVRDFANQAVRNKNDQVLVQRMCDKLRSLETTQGEDQWGRPAAVPLVDLAPDEVTWERDAGARPPMLRVAFDYVRTVTWPLLDRTDEITMSVEHEQDIEPPTWGTSK
jgi:hypothetical protein